MPDIGRERFKSRVTFGHNSDAAQAAGLLLHNAEEDATLDVNLAALERDNQSAAITRQMSRKNSVLSTANASASKSREVEEEDDQATQKMIAGRKGFGYSSAVEILDVNPTNSLGPCVGQAFLRYSPILETLLLTVTTSVMKTTHVVIKFHVRTCKPRDGDCLELMDVARMTRAKPSWNLKMSALIPVLK